MAYVCLLLLKSVDRFFGVFFHSTAVRVDFFEALNSKAHVPRNLFLAGGGVMEDKEGYLRLRVNRLYHAPFLNFSRHGYFAPIQPRPVSGFVEMRRKWEGGRIVSQN